MPSLEEQTLNDEDLFVVILSGAGEGRYRNLRMKLARAIYEEEYPSPKKTSEKEKEVEPHRLIQHRFLTEITGTPSKTFGDAWFELVQYGQIESIGLRADYMVSSNIEREANEIRERCNLSEGDYNYLRNIGQKVRWSER